MSSGKGKDASVLKKVEQEEAGKQKIRPPQWFRVVRHVRRTQLRAHHRVVFDLESDPQYKHRPIQEKVELANEIAFPRYQSDKKKHETQKKKKPDLPDFPEFHILTAYDYEEACELINGNHRIKEASQLMYMNLKMYTAIQDNFDTMIEKALQHDDPMKMITIMKSIQQRNKEYAFMHEDPLLRKDAYRREMERKKAAVPDIKLPNYTQSGETKE